MRLLAALLSQAEPSGAGNQHMEKMELKEENLEGNFSWFYCWPDSTASKH